MSTMSFRKDPLFFILLPVRFCGIILSEENKNPRKNNRDSFMKRRKIVLKWVLISREKKKI